MGVPQVILAVCVVAFTSVAAVFDARTKKLPNALTVPAFCAAILFHVGHGASQSGLAGAFQSLQFALGGFATGFGILFVLWLIGGGGGGDVKMMGALGAWLGAIWTLEVFLLSTVFVVIGSVGVLAYAFIRTGFGRTQKQYLSRSEDRAPRKRGRNSATASDRRARRRLMPFGVPVALATWSVLAYSGFRDLWLPG
jgi:prepilin peptidase CpaA